MEVDVRHIKGHQRKPKRKIFVQSEIEDLIFNLILLMIVFALDDDAFEADIISVEDILRVRVQAPRRSVQLQFKRSMLGTPIIRQAVSSTEGVGTSPTIALRYHTDAILCPISMAGGESFDTDHPPDLIMSPDPNYLDIEMEEIVALAKLQTR